LTKYHYSNKLLLRSLENENIGEAMVVITLKLEDEQAEALANFCSRAGFKDFRNCAITEKEATNMLSSSYLIAIELAKAGIKAK
jgi:hypothetical protein